MLNHTAAGFGYFSMLLMAAICLSSAHAQEQADAKVLSDAERVEKMLVLNETGIISVTYDTPWFWEVGDYATSLGKFFMQEIALAQTECEDSLAKLKADRTAHLGNRADAYIGSVTPETTIRYERLISSLLQKHANSEWVDHESEGNPGKLTPLGAELCSDTRPDSPGLIRQMFPSPENPGSIGGNIWAESICGELHIVRRCLNRLVRTHWDNQKAHKDSTHRVDFGDSSVFQKLEYREAKGSIEAISSD